MNQFNGLKVTPPPDITSLDGSFTFVEIDCDNSGDCTNVAEEDQRPHVMVYSNQCTPEPWFDSTLGKCRTPLVSIENFDVAETPALVGYWDASTNRGGNQIIDRSQYGHHLTLGLSGKGLSSIDDMWVDDGAILFGTRDYAEITVTGTPLDTQAKVVVAVIEFHKIDEGGGHDYDMGTAWDVGEAERSNSKLFSGFSFGVVGSNTWWRMIEGKDALTGTTIPNPFMAGDSFASNNRSAAFIPGVRAATSGNGGAIIEDKSDALTSITTLIAQDQKFRFQALGNDNPAGIKSYQLWAFDTEPEDLDIILRYLSAHPSKLPPWWEGK